MMSKMEFDCKIAHSDEIKRLSGFNSLKELYKKVSQTFSVPPNEILFCTLNTHNFRDMDSLLGNYLSLGDLIVVHICGNGKDLSIKKTQEYLGLTITDNGHGRAFVKKVKSNEGLIEQLIKPGDHIAAINSESTVGMRHYEVAKAIRDVPHNTNFTLHLVEPLYSNKHFDAMGVETDLENKPSADLMNDRANISLLDFAETSYQNLDQLKVSTDSVTAQPVQSPQDTTFMDSVYEDLTNSSIPIDRLLSKGSYTEDTTSFVRNKNSNNNQDSYRHTIEKINSILESFLGINDNALAIQIYRIAKENKDSFSFFVKAIKTSELSVFNFGEDIETYLWNCATGSDNV